MKILIKNTDDLSSVLGQRDEILAASSEFEILKDECEIENQAIRELGKIVLESSDDGSCFYSCT